MIQKTPKNYGKLSKRKLKVRSLLFPDHFGKKISPPDPQSRFNEQNSALLIKENEQDIKKSNQPEYIVDRQKMTNILKNLPYGKSAGFSEVRNEHFKFGTQKPLLIELVSRLMEKIINNGIVPNFLMLKKLYRREQKHK
ncbi:hypothetical protein BpHYR1_052903 [Brachionus plicatilis]|uniref:RNA-directed DNA polymerase from mobile element jockey-like n=1 Tax=Brachionus plicatilis TaxID=10195 RepID=A0A3M7RFT0_BRAPC|nr:hypothetical protein BpHYR1_052903 [Brachionus plicatilis]